jgi:hypothetical protein
MIGNVCLTTDHQLLSIINNNIYSSSHKLILLIRLAGETGVLPHHRLSTGVVTEEYTNAEELFTNQ